MVLIHGLELHDGNRMLFFSKARIRIGDMLTIKGLPEPVVKISRSLPVQIAGLQAHLRYEVPIPALMDSIDALYKPPARFLLR